MSKAWRAAHPVQARLIDTRKKLRLTYGITQREYEVLFYKQRGLCAVCGEPIVSQFDPTRPFLGRQQVSDVGYVDHCHSTKVVRGLLCFNCNVGLGKFRDDEKVLLNAVGYLRASATPQAQPSGPRESLSEIEPGNRDLDSNVRRGSRRDELSPFQD